MSTIVTLIIVLVVLGLALYLVDLLPIPNSTIKRLIQALCVLAALLFILDKTGLFRTGLMH
ncbi:Thivi_2564 family membrane protein [Sorangium sp. So ce1151]|uniref:Thivi_2564 family membrane protein n=1 Tax=Sorangium sp. So ce1151 TaxID=3133332 RepID=UPI003F60400D